MEAKNVLEQVRTLKFEFQALSVSIQPLFWRFDR